MALTGFSKHWLGVLWTDRPACLREGAFVNLWIWVPHFRTLGKRNPDKWVGKMITLQILEVGDPHGIKTDPYYTVRFHGNLAAAVYPCRPDRYLARLKLSLR